MSNSTGWECPRCGKVWAPWISQCDCSRNDWTITCNSSDLLKKYTGCDSDTFRIHPEVGGSDFYDASTNTYTNVVKNCSNCKKEK